jgi:hypothetical protein
MKIDLKKLKEIESQCVLDQPPTNMPVPADLSLFALKKTVDIVLSYSGNIISYENAPINVKIAIQTLKSLGVLVEEYSPKTQQLNS